MGSLNLQALSVIWIVQNGLRCPERARLQGGVLKVCWAAAVVLLLFLGPAHRSATYGQEGVRFRTTSYAGLYELRVVDSAGHVVKGLNREDILVLEDGQPRTIQLFEEESSAQVSAAFLVDIGSNMSRDDIRVAREIVFALIHALDPEDEILLAAYGKDIYFLSDLTQDRTRLVEGIWNIASGGRPRSLQRLATLFGSSSMTGWAVDEALHRLKPAANPGKIVLVFSAGFGNIGQATGDHLQLAGARFFAVSMQNRLGDTFNLGGDQMARQKIVEKTGGFSYSGEEALEKIRDIRDSIKHYYLVAYQLGSQDVPLDRRKVEFRILSRSDYLVRAARRSSSGSSYF